MKKALSFVVLFYSLNLWSITGKSYRFGPETVVFSDFIEKRITVSNHCVNGSEMGDCKALRNLKKLSFQKLERPKFGGANPGSLLCDQQLQGVVIVGVETSSQNENSFCKLADGSIIDNGTLIYYALTNDKKVPSQGRPQSSDAN